MVDDRAGLSVQIEAILDAYAGQTAADRPRPQDTG
jgi:hypothetical protein